jgi:hypothetical protein
VNAQYLRLCFMRTCLEYEGVERIKSVSSDSQFRFHRDRPLAIRAHVMSTRRLTLIVAATQFSLATAHIITILVQMIRGFISTADTPGGTIQYLLSQSNPEHICQSVFYITNVRVAFLVWTTVKSYNVIRASSAMPSW